MRSSQAKSRPDLSRTQDIVTKINILLQEIRDIKKQNKRNNIFNVHKSHPKDTDEESVRGDTHLFYNSASTHLPPNKLSIPEHHAPNPNHTPNIDGSAFAQQKLNPYELWSASPPELLSSSSTDEDSTDDIVDCTRYARIKTGLPLKRVGRGEGELEMEGEWETRGGMEEGRPDPSSGAVTKPSVSSSRLSGTTFARLFLYFTKSNSSFTLVDLIFSSYLIYSRDPYLILPTYLHVHSHTFLIFLPNVLVIVMTS